MVLKDGRNIENIIDNNHRLRLIIQMKFQKILILLYLLGQAILAACINDIAQITYDYIVFTTLTIVFYLASCLKDPGYLLVEQINLPDVKDDIIEAPSVAADTCKLQNTDNPTKINSTAAEPELSKLDHIIQLDDKLQHLGFGKRKNCMVQRDSRFCGICMINQPFRTRHCHECQKCVATYDHHCPWIGSCVGEKNRHYFFLFLVMQTLQTFSAAIGICSTAVNKIIPVKNQWILGISLIIFLSVMLGLTIFHAYLMAANITTWELARWNSIPYMCKFERSRGSPFSKGLARNVREYWAWGFRKTRKIWQFQH